MSFPCFCNALFNLCDIPSQKTPCLSGCSVALCCICLEIALASAAAGPLPSRLSCWFVWPTHCALGSPVGRCPRWWLGRLRSGAVNGCAPLHSRSQGSARLRTVALKGAFAQSVISPKPSPARNAAIRLIFPVTPHLSSSTFPPTWKGMLWSCCST